MNVGHAPSYLGDINHRVTIEATPSGGLFIFNDTTNNLTPMILQRNMFITNNSAVRPTTGFYSDVEGLGQGEIRAVKAQAIGGKAAIGVFGYSRKSTSSYGKFSASIMGSSQGLSISNVVNGTYAGYFKGDVRVTGTIYGTVLSPSASSGGSGTGGEGDGSVEDCSEDEPSVTESLQQVELIKMTRVNNDGSLAANKVVEKPVRTNNDAAEGENLDEEECDDEPIQTQLSSVSYGLAADQLKQVYPELVYEDAEGNYSINYIEMVPLLVQSIKELSAEVTELRQQLGMQKAKKSKQQTSAIDKAKDAKPNKKSTTYDLSGRPATNPQRGVYVQDGKKVAIK